MYDHPDIDLHRLADEMAPMLPEASDWSIPTHRGRWPSLNTEIGGHQAGLNLLRVGRTVFRRTRLGHDMVGESPGEPCLRVSAPGLEPETHARIQTAFIRVMHRWGLLNPWYGKALLDLRMVRDMTRWRSASHMERLLILDRLKPWFRGTEDVAADRILHLRKLLDDYSQWHRDWTHWDDVTRYRGHFQPICLEPAACSSPPNGKPPA
jgi:hypothetical protein